jgi:GTP-binding protein
MKIAIIGRPNVGKSSLFNVFTRSRDALVHDRPGVTRDVISGVRDGLEFLDTAGLENNSGPISKDATELAVSAAKKADVVLFVVDARVGLHQMDIEWAKLAKRANKNIKLLANKCESKKGTDNLNEFYKLGLGEPFPVSAEHNIGLFEVLSNLKSEAKSKNEKQEQPSDNSKVRIAIMGVPNVGKSTLVNRLVGEKRVIVRNEAGTTRDVIHIPARFLGRDIEIIDTAGLRRKAKVSDDVETLAALKALDVLSHTDIVILVLDSTKTIEKQSIQLAEKIYDAGRVLCVALNKWDLITDVEREDRLLSLKHLFNNSHSQIIKPLILPISAEKGTGVNNMMRRIYEQFDISNTRVPTSLINRTIEKLVTKTPPPMSRLKRPMKIKFCSHTGLHPNVITINVGGASDIPDSYTRYLRRGVSEKLGWESIPVVIQYAKEENPFD